MWSEVLCGSNPVVVFTNIEEVSLIVTARLQGAVACSPTSTDDTEAAGRRVTPCTHFVHFNIINQGFKAHQK